MGIGHANAKLLLFGEHSAVYGKPAVGVSLPLSLTIYLEATPNGGRRAPDLDADDEARLEEVCRFIDTETESYALPADFDIRIESSIPRAAGLGSSAAFSVALIRSLPAADEYGDREVWEHSNFIERYFHGTPSGIDTGLSLLGGIQAFYPDPPALPAAKRLPGIEACLVVGTVRRERSTRDLVARVRRGVEEGDSVILESIDELGLIATSAIDLMTGTGGYDELARYADDAHSVLRAMDLSSELMELVLEQGRRFGASGGKLSGGGGGGAFYLVTRDADSARAVSTRLATWIAGRRLPVRLHGSFALVDGGCIDVS